MRREKRVKNKRISYWILLVCGIILFCIGGFVLKAEQLNSLSAVFIGLGAGSFGMAAGELIKMTIIDKNPEYKRKADIEAGDERNIHINSLAKAKAFDIMGTIYGIVMLIFVLMNQSMATIILLVSAYMLSWTIYIVLLNRYSKQM